MSTKIGFVILSHNNPRQLRRLVLCLQRTYDNPSIAIHHDAGQSRIRREDFPADIKFVTPHLKTGWGKFSLVAAALRALELLYEHAAPEWFILLSAADYPTMPADMVLTDLASSGMDALLDYREVPNLSDFSYVRRLRISKYSVDIGLLGFDQRLPMPENPALRHFVLSSNLAIAWRRYIGLHVWLPVIRSGPRIGRYTVYLPFEDWRAPFAPDFRCLYGDQWFTGNRKVAEILLKPTDQHMRLRRHLRFRYVADECYYQTVLGNTPGLKISKATRRFVDWSDSAGGPHGGSHPRMLGLNDLPAIIASKSHFARKFAPECSALDEIDNVVL
jgi:Core-2/I-Branching enzyme